MRKKYLKGPLFQFGGWGVDLSISMLQFIHSGWGVDLSISMFQFIHSGWGVGVGATVAWVGASQVW